MKPVRHLLAVLPAMGLAGLALIIGTGAVLSRAERTPREWALYLQEHAAGHGPWIGAAADRFAGWLVERDRLAPVSTSPLPAGLGASPDRSGLTPAGTVRSVSDIAALRDTVATAQPGDVIEVQPGRYRVQGAAIALRRPGTPAAPIILRAERPGAVTIESDAVETFKIVAPFWHIENLVIRGICADHSLCEHAIHVAGNATGVVIRNNRLDDFNAQIKINGEDGNWPDRGLILGNTLTDTSARRTSNPVTPVDLVGASDWRVSGNVIADFARGIDGEATYGGFFKGAGENNVFERNLVLCAWKLTDAPGRQIGLSLGGGATDIPLRREAGQTGLEQTGSVIRDNLIAFCGDDGIYLNRAARSLVDHNTLLDTAGIDARFPGTSATVTANIVDGAVRGRDGAALTDTDNAYPFILALFAGMHPQRAFYRDPARLDLAWRRQPDSLVMQSGQPDLCGRPRGVQAPQGAFVDFSACLTGQ